jgi:hypothetical protein
MLVNLHSILFFLRDTHKIPISVDSANFLEIVVLLSEL